MNRKVLLISYFFPPIGGGGAIRLTKFVKYLPLFGWKPYILTVKEGFYSIKDQSLLKETARAKITRVKYFEPALWFRKRFWQSFLAYFLYPLFLIPDRQILWFFPALLAARKLIRQQKIRIIFTSASSYSDHLIALWLKKITTVKWVADFRDEWTKSPFFKFSTPIHKKIIQFLEKRILESADVVTTISTELTNQYQEILGVQKEKFLTISNGFDQSDFKGLKVSPPTKNFFRFVHAGSLYGSRQANIFLETLEELKLKNVKVEFLEKLPHHQALEKLLAADVLLLFLSPQDSPAVMTGKIFEYLAARKPILALAPDHSGAAQLIKKLKVGQVAHPLDKKAIKEKIHKFYQLWQHGKLSVPLIDLAKYDRQYLTGRLAKTFDRLMLTQEKKRRRLKLCLIGNIRSPQNQNLVEFFKKKNYEIHFISNGQGKLKGIKSYYLGKNNFTPWYFLRSLMKTRRLIAKIRPDIVHGQDLVFAGIWAYLSGFRPLVVTPWGSDVMNYEKFIDLEKYLIKKTLKQADLVTVSSEALLEKAQEIGLPKGKAKLIHFGIDLSFFRRRKVEHWRRKYKLKNAKKAKIIYCPRSIAPIYNTDILIDAFAKIASRENVKLLITTQNAQESFLIEIEKAVIKNNLVDKVIFLPSLQFKEIPNLYNLADVIVSLTSSDGCSVSFLEGLASEKKIIATKLPYLKEWFTGHNLWTVPIRDVEATARALITALNFPAKKWRPIGRQNRQMITEKAEINVNFEKLDKLYQDLI